LTVAAELSFGPVASIASVEVDAATGFFLDALALVGNGESLMTAAVWTSTALADAVSSAVGAFSLMDEAESMLLGSTGPPNDVFVVFSTVDKAVAWDSKASLSSLRSTSLMGSFRSRAVLASSRSESTGKQDVREQA